MHRIHAIVRRHQLASFLGLAFALLGAITVLAANTPAALPLLLSVVPAMAAFIVAALTEGRAGLHALMRRCLKWPRSRSWLVVVLVVPLLGTLAMVGVAVLLGAPTATRLGRLSLILFIFAYLFNGVEEVAWRGYALPYLLGGRSALAASLLLGIPWAIFHLPLHLPGQWYAAIPIGATPLILLAYSVLLTWIFIQTRGSVLMVTLFHGTLNALTPLTAGIDPEQAWWLRAVVFGVAALLVVLVYGRNLSRRPAAWPAIKDKSVVGI
jgi:uncharacterized protein